MDAIDVNFFPVSPAMFFRDDRSCVACQENTKGVNTGLQNMTDHTATSVVLPGMRFCLSDLKH